MQETRRDVFQAIADPTRRGIIALVAAKSMNVNNLAEHFEMTRPAVSKHLRILTECGVLTIHQQGRERFCKANFKKLKEIDRWLDQYRRFWTNKLDALGTFLEQETRSRRAALAKSSPAASSSASAKPPAIKKRSKK